MRYFLKIPLFFPSFVLRSQNHKKLSQQGKTNKFLDVSYSFPNYDVLLTIKALYQTLQLHIIRGMMGKVLLTHEVVTAKAAEWKEVVCSMPALTSMEKAEGVLANLAETGFETVKLRGTIGRLSTHQSFRAYNT